MTEEERKAAEMTKRLRDKFGDMLPIVDRLRIEMRNEEIQRRLGITAMKEFADAMRVTQVSMVGLKDWLESWVTSANADVLGFGFDGGRIQRNERENVGSLLGLDDLAGTLDHVRDRFGDVADAAGDVTEAMLNVPEVFDAQLARFQAARAGRGAVDLSNLSPQGQGGGGRTWIIENLNLNSNDPDALARKLEELATRRTGSPVYIPGRNINPGDIGRL